MKLPNFLGLFADGKEIDTEIGRVTLRARPAGELTVTSGRVVACDPLSSPEDGPYARAVPAGTFPVTLGVAHIEDGDRRVAGALVRFAEGAPASWEMALREGEELSELDEDEVFGYPVDSGTGCFMDEEMARLVAGRADDDEAFADAVIDEMERNYEDTWSWADIELDPDSGANIVAFSTGVGDGRYASYFGLGESGEVVCLVTDFSLFEYEDFA